MAHDVQRPVVPVRAAPGAATLKPLDLVPAEIAALCNTWPNKLDTAIIPGKVHKQEKRVLLPFDPEATPPITTSAVALPFAVGDRLYVNERVQVIDRPDDADFVRIKYLADDEVRMVLFEEGEPRPKLGLMRAKVLPVRYARGDRLVVRANPIARLWDITEAEARLEGAFLLNHRHGVYAPNATYRMGFEAMWNELHASQHSFTKANWWVQVLTLIRDFDDS